MKALDTPILIDLLRGRPSAIKAIRALSGDELATTELNLFELGLLARANGAAHPEKRLAAVDRLRRKLTVLPVDPRAVRWATEHSSGPGRRISPWMTLMLGAIEANLCSEWIVGPPRLSTLPRGTRVLARPYQ
jgi:hypothetical protein